jgi:hypothetical protein
MQAALVGLLALFLLVASTLSVSHTLHQALHGSDPAGAHLCLLCSLVKGQVSVAEGVFLLAALVLCWFACTHIYRLPLFSGFDYRLSPSRAPPRS